MSSQAAPGRQVDRLLFGRIRFTECLPIYSGGLGVLSGDHLKSASDCDLPLVAVALLYQRGYFRQYLNADGWQQERYPDKRLLHPAGAAGAGCRRQAMKVDVKLPTGPGHHRSGRWRSGGHAIPAGYQYSGERPAAGSRDHRSLYGGDTDTRIRQEIVLGIGGLRALEGAGTEADRLSHERRPLGVSGAGTHPRAHAGAGVDFRRGAAKPPAPTTSSPPTRRCRPESICSIPA